VAVQDVYVYRDDSEPALAPSGAARSADESAYWYDVLSEDPAPEHPETRGPFEPLVSSAAPPAAGPEARTEPPLGQDSEPDAGTADRVRKLEQLKDLYLTAEAIGERNPDRHFDELMAQQRQLISDYFGQPGQPGAPPSAAASPRDGEAEPRPGNGEVTPPEGVAVWAEPPRG
jgi:hypothetical protein